MIIVFVISTRSNRINVQLEHVNMLVDPRHIGKEWGYKFRFSVKGRTLTITRIDQDAGWNCFWLRVYLPTDTIPDFTSTVYTYHGLVNERAPPGTTEVIFHPSVTIIQARAFYNCESSLVRVTIPDTVTRIEDEAFYRCFSLRFIRLSANLEYIGTMAFFSCKSLEVVFLPPTVTRIGNDVFYYCKSLRFINLPETIEHIGEEVFKGCDALLATFNLHWWCDYNQDKVIERLRQLHVNLPCHQACCSTSVTSQQIEACFQEHGIARATEIDDRQMTALHILCLNPHVTGDCIRAYLQLAPEASNQHDSFTMTPFQYLCKRDFAFLEDRNFSCLMIWWYHCMPPQTATSKKRKRG